MIPARLLNILRSCERDDTSHFPPTEVYNEGWMLRLVLDAIQTLGLHNHPLGFLENSRWYSEALLSSPFRPRARSDSLGEGFTNADGVIGHFAFGASTKAGLQLHADARQFVVVEAKMFSNLSTGTKNAVLYDQAARNVACMAEAISQRGKAPNDFERLAFFVLAPAKEKRGHHSTNLEDLIRPDSIKGAVSNRIDAYEKTFRSEAVALREWEQCALVPFVDTLTATGSLAVLSWEEIIDAIRERDRPIAEELSGFYRRCLTYAPLRQS